jgi:hypothetical protein
MGERSTAQKGDQMKPEIKGYFILPDPNPMDIILHGLRPTMDDEHEKKKLEEKDEIWKGNVTEIIRRPHGK